MAVGFLIDINTQDDVLASPFKQGGVSNLKVRAISAAAGVQDPTPCRLSRCLSAAFAPSLEALEQLGSPLRYQRQCSATPVGSLE